MELLRTVTRAWWVFLLRGILAVIFGVVGYARPGAVLAALVLLFGFWMLLDGASAFGAAVGTSQGRWALVLAGVAGVTAGVLTLARPAAAAVVLYTIVAVWAIAHGIFEIVAALAMRKVIRGELWMILGGALSIGFGVLLLTLPPLGVAVLAYTVSAYAVLFGALMIALSLRLRSFGKVALPPALAGPSPQPT